MGVVRVIPIRCSAVAALLLLAACGEDTPREPPAQDPQRNPPHARVDQHRQFQEDLAAVRHPSDGGGRASLVETEAGPARIAASARGCWTIRYQAGPHGIATGGAIYFLPEPFWGWTPPQGIDPNAPGYVTATTSADGVRLESSTLGGAMVRLEIGGRALAPDEIVEIVYGAGGLGARADRYAERDSRLWLAVDGDGDGVRQIVDQSPRLTILPGPAERLVLTLSSSAPPGGPVRLTCAVLDGMANLCDGFQGELELVDRPQGLEVPSTIELGPDDGGCRTIEFRAGEPGVVRLRGRLELGDRSVTATSNPLWVNQQPLPVLWGDLHGHSNFSDGTGLPEDYFRYARDVAALDVVSLTDHDHFGVRFLDSRPELWREIRSQVARYHQPDRFVTLLGFEWTSWLHGHRHVLYFQEDGELLSCLDPETETPAQLWSRLEGTDALTFAHHSAGEPVAVNWSFPPDPRFEPVTEIMSVHGNSESPDAPRPVRGGVPGNFVRDVLEQGHRLGFIGSGDGHDGHPGLPHLSPSYGFVPGRTDGQDPSRTIPPRMGTGGLAAIRTDRRTRAAVREAMLARAVYATSGPRILLDLDLHGHGMGESVRVDDLPAEPSVTIMAIGTGPLQRVDLIQHRVGISSRPLEGRLEIGATIRIERPAPGDFFYVRLLQQDGGVAWSSPVFFE